MSSIVFFCCLFICIKAVVDQLPWFGKRELICLLLFTCNYVVSVWRGFLFLWVLGMGYVIVLWHSLSLPYNYLARVTKSVSPTESKQTSDTLLIKNYFPLFYIKV